MQGSVSKMTVAEMMIEHGYKKVKLADGKKYYITRDEKERSVVGPEVGQRRKRWQLWRKKNTAQPEAVQGSRIVTQEDVKVTFGGIQVPVIRFELPPLTTPAPAPQVGLGLRMWWWWLERFYNDEWHRSVRNTMFDFLLGGVALVAFVALAKALVWMMS